ncbi:hypothetical protein [Pseudomonas sp. R5(2019)]|uniref:hypothetical protein n=1 Tax=Pseudomonas sp. R5(2019) TaxID=2697566 RepID=UPI0014130DE1|nr:hypothetical protein [Pseudomonas sp. R5(2019)]NBA93958.1 hypothetical protein [Pseudomonas sp. R5(2019)]
MYERRAATARRSLDADCEIDTTVLDLNTATQRLVQTLDRRGVTAIAINTTSRL